MDNPSTQKTKQEYVPHSGKLPEEMREVPIQPSDTNLDQTDLKTPDSLADLDRIESNEKKSKLNKLVKRAIAVVAGAVVAGTGTVIAVNATSHAQDTKPVASPAGEPSPDATPTQGGEVTNPAELILNNPNRISPSDIAVMSGDQLTQFATITTEEAPTPEAYAKEFVKVYDAWINSGTTADEFAPSANAAKGVYESAMGEKYDPIFNSTLFAAGIHSPGAEKVHKSVLNDAQSSMLLESDVPYSYANVYKDSTLVTGSADTTTEPFVIDINVDVANNVEETGVSSITHEKNVLDTTSWELSVVNNNGQLEATKIEIK